MASRLRCPFSKSQVAQTHAVKRGQNRREDDVPNKPSSDSDLYTASRFCSGLSHARGASAKSLPYGGSPTSESHPRFNPDLWPMRSEITFYESYHWGPANWQQTVRRSDLAVTILVYAPAES